MLLWIGAMTPDQVTAFAAIVGVAVSFYSVKVARDALRASRQALDTQRQANEDTRKDAALTQFEGQFYKMLELHKTNVDEMVLNGPLDKLVKGRSVFEYATIDFHKAINSIIVSFIPLHTVFDPPASPDALAEENAKEKGAKTVFALKFHYAYQLFFWGETQNAPRFRYGLNAYSFAVKTNWIGNTHPDWASALSTYYRHLFMLVRFVVESKAVETHTEKMRYLKMIRAQLSNAEQLTLFYNWLSGYGAAWENEENHFLTQYKMIHNIFIGDIYNHLYFSDAINDLIKRHNNNSNDGALFEFQGMDANRTLLDMELPLLNV